MDNKKTPCQLIPDLWFSENRNDQRAAKEACEKCPILAGCRERGWDQVHGVWGGLSELDRRKIDPAAYAAAVAKAKRESAEFDVVVAGVVDRLRKQRAESVYAEERPVHLPYKGKAPAIDAPDTPYAQRLDDLA